MNRRKLLIALGATVLTAGCTSGSGEPSAASSDTTAEDTAATDGSTATSAATSSTVDRATTTLTRSATTDPSPNVTTRSATLTVTPTLGPADFRDAFASAIEANGVTVESLAASAGTVRLDYVSGRRSVEEVSAEIGMIAGSFFDQVDRGWDVERLEATLVDGDGSPQATWFADGDWLARYHDGEITAEELTTRILETLEAVE